MLDLVEERADEAAPRFLGLVDGRELVRSDTHIEAGAALVRAALR